MSGGRVAIGVGLLLAGLGGGCARDVVVGTRSDATPHPELNLELVGSGFEDYEAEIVSFSLVDPRAERVTSHAGVRVAGGGFSRTEYDVLDRGASYTVLFLLDRGEESIVDWFRCDPDDLAWSVVLGPVTGDVRLEVEPPAASEPGLCNAFPIPGDVDGDGCVDQRDVDLFLEVLFRSSDPGPAAVRAADVNRDGRVDNFDIDPLSCNAGRGCSAEPWEAPWEWCEVVAEPPNL